MLHAIDLRRRRLQVATMRHDGTEILNEVSMPACRDALGAVRAVQRYAEIGAACRKKLRKKNRPLALAWVRKELARIGDTTTRHRLLRDVGSHSGLLLSTRSKNRFERTAGVTGTRSRIDRAKPPVSVVAAHGGIRAS